MMADLEVLAQQSGEAIEENQGEIGDRSNVFGAMIRLPPERVRTAGSIFVAFPDVGAHTKRCCSI